MVCWKNEFRLLLNKSITFVCFHYPIVERLSRKSTGEVVNRAMSIRLKQLGVSDVDAIWWLEDESDPPEMTSLFLMRRLR